MTFHHLCHCLEFAIGWKSQVLCAQKGRGIDKGVNTSRQENIGGYLMVCLPQTYFKNRTKSCYLELIFPRPKKIPNYYIYMYNSFIFTYFSIFLLMPAIYSSIIGMFNTVTVKTKTLTLVLIVYKNLDDRHL